MQAIRKIFKDSILIQSTAIVFASSFLVNVLNYIFTIFVARNLTVESYGEVATLFSLLIIFSVPAGALSAHTIREVARKQSDQKAINEFKSENLQEVGVVSLMLWIIFLIITPLLSQALQLEILHLWLFSLLLPLGLFGAYHAAFFQGLHNFLTSSKLSILGTVGKLLFAVILIYLGFSVVGVVMALVLSQLMTLVVAREAFVGFQFKITNLFKNVIGVLQNQIISVTFFATLFLALLSNLDVLLAKYFLDSYTAGSYGAISTLGKIVLFATGAFVTVMLPLVSKSQDTNTFYKTFFALFCSGLAVVAVFYLFSAQLVHLLFGLKYEGIISYVPTFALAIFFVSLSTALVNYFLAVKNKSFLVFLGIGIFVECLLLWYNHATINGFVQGVLYANILLTILLGLNFALTRNPKRVHEKDIFNNSSL